MKRLLLFIPALALVAIATIFFGNLRVTPRAAAPSPLTGMPAPRVALPALDRAAKRFTSADLQAGHVSVVNVWASWCTPCRGEAEELADIARSRKAELYGIVYEDNSTAARRFLAQTGDPFARLDLDADGHEAIAWGIYGVPETFVVDGRGIVRLHYTGPIVPDALQKIIMPAIVSAGREG
ncbi:MAG TPA: DsbE family thiol:disulfide interchange protein [Rhizomicrobium sp.]|nr:DsbE family thiol:disulfide interchange protein [Rhizomicrobium sp.]